MPIWLPFLWGSLSVFNVFFPAHKSKRFISFLFFLVSLQVSPLINKVLTSWFARKIVSNLPVSRTALLGRAVVNWVPFN